MDTSRIPASFNRIVTVRTAKSVSARTSTHSPASVARAFGVSESSLKRWCDAGHVPFTRTAGGHRRIDTADVMAFAKANGHRVVAPEALGFNASAAASNALVLRGRLMRQLVAGQARAVTELVIGLVAGGTPVEVVCDRFVAPALADLGEAWLGGRLEIYQERRACELIVRALVELERLAPPFGRRPLRALGGALTGDPYTLPTLMAEASLRHNGVDARSLGASLPASTVVAAVRASTPRIVWLTVGHVADAKTLVSDVAAIEAATRDAGAALVLGGRALTPELRRELCCAAFCDGMEQLVALARALR